MDSTTAARLPRLCYSVEEVAEALGLSAWTVRRLIREEKLKAKFTGRQYVITRSAVDEWFES